jgi:NADH-quinone oxidoreductase subunit L
MHHEQDMRKMGGLAKYMPITAITCWIGAWRSSARRSSRVLLQGCDHRGGRRVTPLGCNLRVLVRAVRVFVTALYTFRMLFLTFHGPERFRTVAAHEEHPAASSNPRRIRSPSRIMARATRRTKVRRW